MPTPSSSSWFPKLAACLRKLPFGCTAAPPRACDFYYEPLRSLAVYHVSRVNIQLTSLGSYYFLNGDNVTAFPPGFRMIAGDSRRRTYTAGDPNKPDPEKSIWEGLGQTNQATLQQRALGFNCLNYGRGQNEDTLFRHVLPEKGFMDANCADGVRFELMFPSCWNGRDLDSATHTEHVAYPKLVMNNACPPGFPVQLPALLFETIWATNAFRGRNGRFVIANGDTTGTINFR
jgi:hypothetical protein